MYIYFRLKSLYIILFLLTITLEVFCQGTSLLQEIKQDSAISLYLTQDWKQIEKHKKDKAYQSANVRMITTDKDTITIPAKVRTRGNMRLISITNISSKNISLINYGSWSRLLISGHNL